MKLRTSQKNLSLQLVALMAAVSSGILYTAIAEAQSANHVSDYTLEGLQVGDSISDFKFGASPLLAQARSFQVLELGLALPESHTIPPFQSPSWSAIPAFTGQLAEPLALDEQPLLVAQLLVAQWSAFDVANLSLAPQQPNDTGGDRSYPMIEPLSFERLQLIAQARTDFAPEKISLAIQNTISPAPQTDTLASLLKQSTNANPVIAQVWSLKTQDFSFADPLPDYPLTPASELSPLQPSSKPVINPPDKRILAARLALEKVQIVSPAPGVILDESQSDRITIQYPHNASVKLEVNGQELDRSLVTQREVDPKRNLVTQTWRDANLRSGENILNVIASKDGVEKKTSREVMVRDTSEIKGKKPDLAPESANATQNKPSSAGKTPDSLNKTTPATERLVKILTPTNNAVLDTIHSSVIIQYPQAASVILQLNGKSVDSSQVGRTEANPQTGLVTQTWYSVIFKSGVNQLSILATTDGSTYEETSIEVVVPGEPDGLKVSTVESEIPADGNAIAMVTGQFVDEFGTVTPWNETITLDSSAGKFIGTDLKPDVPGFQVKPVNGEFRAKLQAGYDAKNVKIRARTSKFESYAQIRFKTTLREKPLLTGYASLRLGARGTDYYDSFRDFLPLDEDNGFEVDYSSAAFISGSFGRWSYTGAFNSDRAINEDENGDKRLFNTFSSQEEDYPVYGDSSTSESTTPSTDNVFLRLERNPRAEFAEPDYFMWGDYKTEEFSTDAQEFTAISRQLHGFKSNYNLGRFQLNAFYANNAEGFQRDTIAPDGTSGFYFFSRRQLVPGSESVFIELTPFNDPGNIVSRQRLNLGTDYEINYDRGTILFNDPVSRTQVDSQGNILARRIVTTYQFEESASESNLIAGKGSYFFKRDSENPSWLSASYLYEDRGDLDFVLWGMDSQISLGSQGRLIAEYANSDNQTIFGSADGSAYRLEGDFNFSDQIRGRAFYRQTDAGFTNNATSSFIPGQTRYGSQIQAQIADSTKLNFTYEHQDNEGVAPRPLDQLEEFIDTGVEAIPGNAVDNSLDTISAGVEQQFGEADLGMALTWRKRSDRESPEVFSGSSAQLQSRFSTPIWKKLSLNLLNDLTISNNTDVVFSDRLGIGLGWELYDGLSLAFNQQWFTRGTLAGESLTSLGINGEYEPWSNATLTGRYAITGSAEGPSNVGAIGLQQKITVAPGLDIDLDYEHTFSGLDANTSSTGRQFSQPTAVGQSASSLSFDSGSSYGVGISYSDNPNYTASARWQQSNKANGNNTVISADVTGKLTNTLTSLLSYSQASSANQSLNIGISRDLRLGLAYRNPQHDKFNALLRYEYEENGGTIPETLLIGQGTGTQEHLFGMEAIYAPDWRWEFYGKYAFRNAKTFLADDFVGSTNISLGQLRATYRLNYHFDLVAEGRGIWQPDAGYTESGFVLESGYYLTPEFRLSAGYVFGKADDEDFTGTRSAGGPYMGLTVKLNSLLDGFGQHSQPSLPEGVVEKAEGAALKDTASHKERRERRSGGAEEIVKQEGD
ncbi:MAG: hypothetical protein AAFO95_06905 [Cyanobacteria bacterium J06600_6]